MCVTVNSVGHNVNLVNKSHNPKQSVLTSVWIMNHYHYYHWIHSTYEEQSHIEVPNPKQWKDYINIIQRIYGRGERGLVHNGTKIAPLLWSNSVMDCWSNRSWICFPFLLFDSALWLQWLPLIFPSPPSIHPSVSPSKHSMFILDL